MLTSSEKCDMAANAAASKGTKFTITGTKVYVPIVTLSTDDNSNP